MSLEKNNNLFITSLYEEDIWNEYQIIVILLPFSEISPEKIPKCNNTIFYFPLHLESICKHQNINSNKCRKNFCGNIIPFEEMNSFLDYLILLNKKTLILDNLSFERSTLLCACFDFKKNNIVNDSITSLSPLFKNYFEEYISIIKS